MTDHELLEAYYQQKDSQLLGELLQRYTLLLLGVCMKYLKNEEEAKDAVQQIFMKAITELGKYKVSYLKSWLYMVAKNYCLMKLRNQPVFVAVDEKNDLIAPENLLPQIAEKESTLQLLEIAINDLNQEQKTCVTLFYLHKQSYQEIVNATGYNLLQVKSHIQNGKRNLKKLLEKKMEDQQ
jgi:RNA polymerase sigma-70 factor (ECF subfamily)